MHRLFVAWQEKAFVRAEVLNEGVCRVPILEKIKKRTPPKNHSHYLALICTLECFQLHFLHPYVPFGWWQTWPSHGCPAPPRALGPPQPLAPSLSEGGEELVVSKERSKAAPVVPSATQRPQPEGPAVLADWNCFNLLFFSSIFNSPEPTASFFN